MNYHKLVFGNTIKKIQKEKGSRQAYGEKQWLTDEPKPMGTDLGPTPYDYLLSALGGCIAMT